MFSLGEYEKEEKCLPPKLIPCLMLPAHLHDAAGDLFTTVEKILECPKFWQCSCQICFHQS